MSLDVTPEIRPASEAHKPEARSTRRRGRHALSEVDADRQRGTCATCGPEASLKYKRQSNGRLRLACRTGDRGKSAKSQERALKYRTRYGITIEDYETLSQQQDGRCALCGGLPRGTKRLHVDHCHETGRVRGLLCIGCNRALGALGDSPEGLARALTYVTG